MAEQILARGDADMVSMARPLLADPEWVNKARSGKADRINTCIACNQACLDHVFENRHATCLVNPRACNETELVISPSAKRKALSPSSVPARPGWPPRRPWPNAAMQSPCSTRPSDIGGQFNMAKRIPGKEEFHETLRYFGNRIADTGVELRLGTRATADVLAAGRLRRGRSSRPASRRAPCAFPAAIDPRVLSYLDVLRDNKPVGKRVAIIGAGGIGFDVGEFLVEDAPSPTTDVNAGPPNGASTSALNIAADSSRRNPKSPNARSGCCKEPKAGSVRA